VQNGQAKKQDSAYPCGNTNPPALAKVQETCALAAPMGTCHRLIDASLTIHVTNSS
jgi:hypothetical protein